jgi:hypothetical protein
LLFVGAHSVLLLFLSAATTHAAASGFRPADAVYFLLLLLLLQVVPGYLLAFLLMPRYQLQLKRCSLYSNGSSILDRT